MASYSSLAARALQSARKKFLPIPASANCFSAAGWSLRRRRSDGTVAWAPRGVTDMNAVASRKIKFVSHSDQGGRGDGVQVMVHRGYAYIGHTFSNGITVLDVRDPKHPKTVEFIACPPNTRAIHLQTHEDLLLATNLPSVWRMQVL